MDRLLCRSLVGRDQALAVLGGALDDAAAGRGTSVVVLGEAGIGKSRLARWAVDQAEARQFSVLVGRGSPSGGVALGPLSEALLGFLRRTRRGFEGADLEALRPVLGRLTPAVGTTGDTDRVVSAVVVGEALLRMLPTVTGGGAAMLVLEDLHWADPDTLAVVEYLARTVPDEPLLLLATARSEDRSPALGLARRLAAARLGTMLELDRLDGDQVGAMVRDCLGADPVPEPVDSLLRAQSDGVPLLVEELLAGLVHAGALVRESDGWRVVSHLSPGIPRTFADSVHQRLRTFDDGGRRVLHAAAVLGRRFEWALLGPLSGVEDATVLVTLRQAVTAQLLDVVDDQGFRFRHALTRDAILADLLPPERVALCRSAALAVERAHPGVPGGWSDLAASLFEQGGDHGRAAELWFGIGVRALDEGALASAEIVLDRARALTDDSSRWLAASEVLADVLALAGKTERAFEIGSALVGRLSLAGAAPERLTRAHLRLARAASAAGRWELAASHLAGGRRHGEGSGDERLGAALDVMGALVSFEQGRTQEAADLATAALAAGRRSAAYAVACEALEVLGREARSRDLAAAREFFGEAVSIATANDLIVWQLRARHELATVDLLEGTDVEPFAQVRELALEKGAWGLAATVDLQIAAGLVLQARAEEALEAARRASASARRFRLAALPKALVLEAAAHALRGRARQMEVLLAEAHDLAPDDAELEAFALGQCRGTLAIVDADRAGVRRCLGQANRLLGQAGISGTAPFQGLWAVLVAVEGGGGEEVEEVPRRGLRLSGIGAAFLACADAVLMGRAGQDGEARTALLAAEAAFGPRLSWYSQYSRALVAEAAIADHWGEPAAWLREAAVFFEGSGHDRIAAGCVALLRRAGAPVPRRGRGDSHVPDPLRARGVTSREMDVLRLVIDGLGNRAIATRLHLSPRTVENHVSHLLAKTGSANRTELHRIVEEETATRTERDARPSRRELSPPA